jgi:phosphoribosyl 1,2-cyclic phosphodiesterase
MKQNITIGTLYSGSKGNCTLICTEKSKVLIDAGRSAKYLTTSLASVGLHPCDIDAIFLTHSHTDHTSALKVFCSKNHTPIHATSPVLSAIDRDTANAYGESHPIIYSVNIGNITVTSFPTEHDSQGSVGYRIDVRGESGITTLGVATDLGVVTEHITSALIGCKAAVVESNHDPDMLLCGPYPPELKARIASNKGHLSNKAGAALASTLIGGGAEYILLAHISEINNTPECALSVTMERLRADGCVAQVAVAKPSDAVLYSF